MFYIAQPLLSRMYTYGPALTSSRLRRDLPPHHSRARETLALFPHDLVTQDTITRLGQCIPAFEVACLVGGIPVAEHVRALGRGCHIAVGTPGRVRYLISKGALQPSTARTLILESADCLMAPVFQVHVQHERMWRLRCIFCL